MDISPETLKFFTDLIKTLTDWPVLFFIFIIIYRKKIGSTLPAFILKISERVKSVSVPGLTAEFTDLKNKLEQFEDSILQTEVINSIDTRIKSDSIDEEDIGQDEGEDIVEEETEEDDGFDEVFTNLKAGS